MEGAEHSRNQPSLVDPVVLRLRIRETLPSRSLTLANDPGSQQKQQQGSTDEAQKSKWGFQNQMRRKQQCLTLNGTLTQPWMTR